MSAAIVNWPGGLEAWDDAYVAAILARLNARSQADRAREARSDRDCERKARIWPTPQQVAALVRAHGIASAVARWGYVSEDELHRLARAGGATVTECSEEVAS